MWFCLALLLPGLIGKATRTQIVTPGASNQGCDSGWFGVECIFKCQCNNSVNCSTNGDCPGNGMCESGYFGPACQYVDLTVSCLSGATEQYLKDTNHQTCNPQLSSASAELTFTKVVPLSWLRIVVNNNECPPHTFGDTCDQKYPGNSLNGTCLLDSGLCVKCKPGYTGVRCQPAEVSGLTCYEILPVVILFLLSWPCLYFCCGRKRKQQQGS